MTAVDIQNAMGAIFEGLKVLEVQLQQNEAELEKSLAGEKICVEGLEGVRGDFQKYRAEEVVCILEFVKVKGRVETVEKFHDQSQSLRLTLQCKKRELETAKENAQATYDRLGAFLGKATNNIVLFGSK